MHVVGSWRPDTDAAPARHTGTVPGYLDHASSEPLAPAARETLLAALDAGWADPARLHSPARRARLLLDNARAVVAECLDARPEEVGFTTSGTEAVHRGVLGLLGDPRDPRHGDRIVLSAVEHSAVFAAARWWADRATDPRAGDHDASDPVVEVGVDHEGQVLVGDLAAALGATTRLVAVQQANAEVSTLQPVPDVVALARDAGAPVFVDACGTAALLPPPPDADCVALSAHKWGGPAGVGVLLVRKHGAWRTPLPLDERTDPVATGFENVPAALAAAAALQVRVADRDELTDRYRALGSRLVSGLREIPDVDVHGPDVLEAPERRLPHLVSFSLLYLDGETLVHELDRRGLQVASGSACTSSALEPSHVLVAMGALTHGNVRVSFGPETQAHEVDDLVRELREIVPRLRGRAR